jgi:hypothetical protein
MHSKVVPSLLLLLGVVLITIGFAKWFTTTSLLKRQNVAAYAFLQTAMRDEAVAPGLENSPQLLEVIYLAAGTKQGVESCIIIVATGLMVVAIRLFIFKQQAAAIKLQLVGEVHDKPQSELL